MKGRVITLDSNDVYKNIAQEYKYFLELKDEVILLLWQNSPSVIMGRNQNVYRELDLEYIKSREINIARRFTGGGAVYHDLGNLNFTIIFPQKYKDIELWMEIVQTALSKLHIPSERKGRNDLLLDGKKFSGMAWLDDEDKFMIHGTLMVDLDLNQLYQCLTPDMSKFVGKGIKSIRSRVCNLKEKQRDISIEKLSDALIETFCEKYPNSSIEKPKAFELYKDIYNKLKSSEWIFGKNEKANIEKTYNIENKPCKFEIWIENDIILKLNIYSDTLQLDKIEKLEQSLLNKKYSEIQIDKEINSIWG